jgi:uncharacterized iron-regulated membrane protein
MATLTRNLSKWLLVSGGALIVAGLIIALTVGTSSPTGVSAQATPARTATPAAAAKTATPAAAAKTATPAAAAKTATPKAAAPGALPANGDSVTFPALAIALAGAGLVGFGLFARYAMGKSKA